MPTNALIALGSNQPRGDNLPADTLRAALARLSDSQLILEKTSPFYLTPAFPAGSGPDFVNATISVSGAQDAAALLRLLHEIEAEFGRERRQRWGQRVLDLDLLALGDAVLPDRATHARWRDAPLATQMREQPTELILPHPRLQDRAFVLVPLADIAPDWIHPVLGQSVADMLDALPAAQKSEVRPL